MISYYDLLGLVKKGEEPKMVKVRFHNNEFKYYEANYEMLKKGDLTHYSLVRGQEADENYRYYLSECFIEADAFDEVIQIVDIEQELREELYNTKDEKEKFEKLDKLSYQQIGKWFVSDKNSIGILVDEINKQNNQFGQKINELVAHIRNLEKKVEDLEDEY